MIEDPPLVTYTRNYPKIAHALIEKFRHAPVSQIVDAMNGRGALDAAIKPILPGQDRICGRAVTCECGPDDNLGLLIGISLATRGDVLVVATQGWAHSAVTGDLTLGMAKNKGAVGFVTDGMVRDVEAIREVGLPCFAAGITPNSPVRNGPAKAGLPVVMAGVQVHSGDLVVADPDGVVIVPHARIEATAKALAHVQAIEAGLLKKVKEGLQQLDVIDQLMKSDRVREV